MGLTQKLGTIPLAIQTDSSNNVGIGGAANASYKLAVTGAGNFTGALRTSSTFTSGDTIQLGLASTDGGFWTWGASNSFLVAATGKALNLNPNGATGSTGLSIATTGAATFSSTIYTPNFISSDTEFRLGAPFARVATLDSGGGFGGGYNLNWNNGSPIHNSNGALSGYAYASDGTIRFYTNGSATANTAAPERMRITSGGFTKISNSGTYATTNNVHEIRSSTSNDYALLVGNTSAAPYGVYINYPNASPNSSSTNEFFICGDSNNTKLIVWSNGTVVNRTGSYGTISDVTLKENIVDATPKLDDLIKLKVRNFNFIGEDLKQLGFVAQEMEEVFPNMVDTDKEGLKSIKTSILIPMLVKAIQELNAKVTALENR